MNDINVLVACEESQRVTIEFRKLGIRAFSCDLLPCSGDHPEWHIKGDAIEIAGNAGHFKTMDGKDHYVHGFWDLMIAHPPCTYLSNSGVTWLYNKDGSENTERWDNMIDGAEFFKALLRCDHIPHIAIENPIMHKYAKSIIGFDQDQVIQPWMFGDNASKATCLWLKSLPNLTPTEIIEPMIVDGKKRWANQTPAGHDKLGPSPQRAMLRSKTYPGIAKAIATQFTEYLLNLYGYDN